MTIQPAPQTALTSAQLATVECMRTGRVMVAGAGVAGKGILRLLCALAGVQDHNELQRITVADDASPLATHTVASAIEALNGEAAPELILTSPGWAPQAPLLATAAELGIPIIGDIEACWLADQAGCFGAPRHWIAITGTNGKTTTTAMTTAMLQQAGVQAVSVGNIGTSPIEALLSEPRSEVLVAEVSSFQLHWAPTFRPTVGCVLNLAEDHLDWHGSFENYAHDKAAVLRARIPVLALDDPHVMAMEFPRNAEQVLAFTTQEPSDFAEFAVLRGISCVVGRAELADSTTMRSAIAEVSTNEAVVLASADAISPPGPAGIADAAAAAAMVRALHVEPEPIAAALRSFQVQAHRGQVVHQHNNIRWVDNSKATNPHAAAAALRGQDNVVWVAGGQLKGASVDELVADIAGQLRAVVVLGVDRQVIVDAVHHAAPHVEIRSIDSAEPEEAMRLVVEAAAALAQPGDDVILAPAAASLDMYTGMAQRGDLFAEFAKQVAR